MYYDCRVSGQTVANRFGNTREVSIVGSSTETKHGNLLKQTPSHPVLDINVVVVTPSINRIGPRLYLQLAIIIISTRVASFTSGPKVSVWTITAVA